MSTEIDELKQARYRSDKTISGHNAFLRPPTGETNSVDTRGFYFVLKEPHPIDFASRCDEIDTSRLAVSNVILGKIGPGSGSLDVGRVCGTIQGCDVCRGSRFEPVKTEADRRFCVAEQIIDHSSPRRKCPPNRHVNIAKSRDIGEPPVLCGLPGNLLTDVFPAQAVGDGDPSQGPGILAVNRHRRVQALLPTSRSSQQCHGGRY